MSAVAAREVFVSTMGVVYGVGALEDEATAPLQQQMSAAKRSDGSAIWDLRTGIGVLIWFAIAMQCMSTTAIVRRETNGWRWPLLQLAGFNAFAYVVCLTWWQVSGLWL